MEIVNVEFAHKRQVSRQISAVTLRSRRILRLIDNLNDHFLFSTMDTSRSDLMYYPFKAFVIFLFSFPLRLSRMCILFKISSSLCLDLSVVSSGQRPKSQQLDYLARYDSGLIEFNFSLSTIQCLNQVSVSICSHHL